MTPQEGLSVCFVVALFMLSMKRVHGRMKRGVQMLSTNLTPVAATYHLFTPIWMDMAMTVVIILLASVLIDACISRDSKTLSESASVTARGLLGGALYGVDALYAMNLALASAGIVAFWYTMWLRIKVAPETEYITMLDVVYGFNGILLPVLYMLHPVITKV